MKNKKTKINLKKIFKILPKGFVCLSRPMQRNVVYARASLDDINLEDARKAVLAAFKEFGYNDVSETIDEESKFVDFKLIDKSFNKQMVADARNCLKIIKTFYSTYKNSYLDNDTAYDLVMKISRIVNHDE